MDDKTTPKYELLEIREDGTEVRRYANGDIRNQNGQLLVLPEQMRQLQITSETAHLRLAQRKQKILDAVEKKIMTLTETSAPAEAIAHIVGKRAQIALKDETRTGNEAAKIVLQMLDAYQEKQTQTTTVQRHEYAIDDETRALIESIAQSKRGSIIDGEVIE